MPLSTKSITKIDVHTHIIPETWPDWNEEFKSTGWLTIKHDERGAKLINSDGTIFRTIERNCWCPKTRVEECDRSGVSIQVLSTVPGIGFNYKAPADQALCVAQYLNDHISGVVGGKYKDRFVGLGTVPLQDIPLAIVELRRCIQQLGLHGVQIGSHINGYSLDTPELGPFWEEVENLDCAVFIHPWDMSTEERMQRYWFPWLLGMPHETAIAMGSMILGGVLEKHPRLRVCFAHGGGCFPALIGRVSHGFEARPDLCQLSSRRNPREFLNQVYVDSLVHDEDILQLLLKKFGPNRIILGSDYPFPLGEVDRPGKLVERLGEGGNSELEDVKKRILWENAVEFLKLELD